MNLELNLYNNCINEQAAQLEKLEQAAVCIQTAIRKMQAHRILLTTLFEKATEANDVNKNNRGSKWKSYYADWYPKLGWLIQEWLANQISDIGMKALAHYLQIDFSEAKVLAMLDKR